MTYKCIACSEKTMGIFFGKEKALFHLFEMSKRQQEVFLYSFNSSEMIMKCLRFHMNEPLEIYENGLYYNEDWLRFYDFYICVNQIEHNILFDYMKRVHKIWCCKDENGKVIWINACNILENCVK